MTESFAASVAFHPSPFSSLSKWELVPPGEWLGLGSRGGVSRELERIPRRGRWVRDRGRTCRPFWGFTLPGAALVWWESTRVTLFSRVFAWEVSREACPTAAAGQQAPGLDPNTEGPIMGMH